MNEKFKKAINLMLVILFPLGILYCLFHAMGKDLVCFFGVVFAFGLGILFGFWILNPQMFFDAWNAVVGFVQRLFLIA